MRRSVALATVVAVWAGCGNRATAVKKDAALVDAPAPDAAGDTVPGVTCKQVHGTNITLRKIATVGTSATTGAVLVTSPPRPRLFAVTQVGQIFILDVDGNVQATPFLDISGDNNGPVVSGGEQGMLGLAFDPSYSSNRQFYVSYTTDNPNNGSDGGFPYLDVFEQFTTKADDPTAADPASGKIILSVLDFAVNHNGGMIEFGSDGYLYISEGDGGSEGDPKKNAQNPKSLLGKMLRIDVDHPAAGSAYGIPSDNPFAANGSGAPEVYIIGLRNPWRWGFDTITGDMWIGDVGQDNFEEVDYLPAGHQAGVNLGWPIYEGNTCCMAEVGVCHEFPQNVLPCNPSGLTFPVITRDHAADGWVAMIGGQVYRGVLAIRTSSAATSSPTSMKVPAGSARRRLRTGS